MKVTVKLSEWYARGLVDENYYDARMLNRSGHRCCLGFCAAQHGIPDIALFQTNTPSEAGIAETWMIAEDGLNSDLARIAFAQNDALKDGVDWSFQPLEVRMGNLITVFAEGGDDLEFVP